MGLRVIARFSSLLTAEAARASLVAQIVESPPEMQETWVISPVRKIPWRRAWHPTLVFLPRESHGQRSLGGYGPWGGKESDTTERLSTQNDNVGYHRHIIDEKTEVLGSTNKTGPN